MTNKEPRDAGEEALLMFVSWVAALDNPGAINERRRASLQEIIDRAKLAKKFYDPPSKRDQLVERIQRIVDRLEDLESEKPLSEEVRDALRKSTLPEVLIEEFQTEFFMLLDEDQPDDSDLGTSL
jgi:hypothetical protein